MSKPVTLAAIIAGLFGRSEKAISEKLSTEEHQEFAADVNELNEKLQTQTAEATRLATELEAANTQITTLEASVTEKEGQITTLNASLTAVTNERNTYKAHYDETSGKGGKEGSEDANSRGKSEMASYNQHAMDYFNRNRATK